jgi:hypothetical protein
MKRFILVVLSLLLIFGFVQAKDFTANVTFTAYSGKDATGNNEASYPLLFKVHDSITNAVVLSKSISTTGPLTNFSLGSFTISVPDNTTKSVSFYVDITDSASTPNTSAKSANSNTVTLIGIDTSPPEGVNEVNITITP